jgi:hypothetical protein
VLANLPQRPVLGGDEERPPDAQHAGAHPEGADAEVQELTWQNLAGFSACAREIFTPGDGVGLGAGVVVDRFLCGVRSDVPGCAQDVVDHVV